MNSTPSEGDSPSSSSSPASRAPVKRYTPEQKRSALIALLLSGNATHAAEVTGIPRQTLESWRDTSEAELWAQLTREHGSQADAILAAQTRDAVRRLTGIEQSLADKLAKDYDRLAPHELAPALKNISAAKTQNLDKLLVLTGRATSIVEHVDARDIIADIRKIVQPYAIDTTAEEETP